MLEWHTQSRTAERNAEKILKELLKGIKICMESAASSYYYQLLDKDRRQVYHAIKTGLENLASSIQVQKLDGRELADIYFMVRMDHPEIFYTVSFKYRFYQEAASLELIPEYIFEKKKIPEHRQALESRVKKLVRPAEKMSEADKELYIHDFICQNITYDKLKKPYSHEIIGSLGQGVAVCEGIAKAVKILCDRLGIWCIIALSDANPEKGIKYRHTWNVVRIGGQYYHLDATFDNSVGSRELIRYDYFNLNDKQFFRDHEPAMRRLPACTDGSRSYYQVKKLSFTKTEEVRNRAGQAAKKGKTLVFHWRGGYLTREVLKELLDIIGEEGKARQKHALISLNWPQAVLQIRYEEDSEAEKQDEVVMQEANEGELYEAEE